MAIHTHAAAALCGAVPHPHVCCACVCVCACVVPSRLWLLQAPLCPRRVDGRGTLQTDESRMDFIRATCMARGANGIRGLSRQFKIIDDGKMSSVLFCSTQSSHLYCECLVPIAMLRVGLISW